MKLTASQERELLRIYRAQEMPPAETPGQRADRRCLEQAGALVWTGWGNAAMGNTVARWELTTAGPPGCPRDSTTAPKPRAPPEFQPSLLARSGKGMTMLDLLPVVAWRLSLLRRGLADLCSTPLLLALHICPYCLRRGASVAVRSRRTLYPDRRATRYLETSCAECWEDHDAAWRARLAEYCSGTRG